jgi:hypothetical protein
MYDNNGRYPLWIDIIQYAERLALDTRTRWYQYFKSKNSEILENKNRKRKIN